MPYIYTVYITSPHPLDTHEHKATSKKQGATQIDGEYHICAGVYFALSIPCKIVLYLYKNVMIILLKSIFVYINLYYQKNHVSGYSRIMFVHIMYFRVSYPFAP
jgi:uncharacterized membrane protein